MDALVPDEPPKDAAELERNQNKRLLIGVSSALVLVTGYAVNVTVGSFERADADLAEEDRRIREVIAAQGGVLAEQGKAITEQGQAILLASQGVEMALRDLERHDREIDTLESRVNSTRDHLLETELDGFVNGGREGK